MHQIGISAEAGQLVAGKLYPGSDPEGSPLQKRMKGNSPLKKDKISLFPDERVAIHAKLGSILKGGDPAEILLVIILLLALRPVSPRKPSKKKGQPNRLP